MKIVLKGISLGIAMSAVAGAALPGPADATTIRVATFNASLNRGADGQLVSDLSTPGNAQARAVAEIIQRINPDILLINEFDYVGGNVALDLFRTNYLQVGQRGQSPVTYTYGFTAPSNTGIPTGKDLDNSGAVGGGNDAQGFGAFPGQFGMALYSKYPIRASEVRTFQNFLWKDMPGARLPTDPATGTPWYSADELAVLRLSSKSHWIVPIEVDGKIVNIIAAHPTPPVFDGPEDRNGKRNADEIRLISDIVTPGAGDYLVDDAGGRGGLGAGQRFVILGDMNADPLDGDSVDLAINQLLANALVDDSLKPSSLGAVQQAALQGGANASHRGDPAIDTADFADTTPGNLRADYVLPSVSGLTPLSGGVFWPLSTQDGFDLVGTFTASLPGGFPASDHRAVFVDFAIDEVPAPAALPVLAGGILGLAGLSLGRRDRRRG